MIAIGISSHFHQPMIMGTMASRIWGMVSVWKGFLRVRAKGHHSHRVALRLQRHSRVGMYQIRRNVELVNALSAVRGENSLNKPLIVKKVSTLLALGSSSGWCVKSIQQLISCKLSEIFLMPETGCRKVDMHRIRMTLKHIPIPKNGRNMSINATKSILSTTFDALFVTNRMIFPEVAPAKATAPAPSIALAIVPAAAMKLIMVKIPTVK